MKKSISISIAGRNFKLSVEEEKQHVILQAASMVEENIENIKKHSNTAGSDKVAILAAINIANDFIEERNKSDKQNNETINKIIDNVDSALKNIKK